MKQELSRIISNQQIADKHFILECEAPRIAKAAKPGQFVQVLDEHHEIFLPRPFSFLDISKTHLRILYQVVGKGTRMMSLKKKGDALIMLGPLGNGWSATKKKSHPRVLLIGGGVGIPPLYHLAKYFRQSPHPLPKSDVVVFLGGRHKKLLHCEREFKALGLKVHVATDDGSKGHKGVITEKVEEVLNSKEYVARLTTHDSRIQAYTCGPTPMLKAVAMLTQKYNVACQVSVEEPMACGFGACLGCAIKVRGEEQSSVRYAISCCEGPVFNAREVLWD